MRVWVLRHVAFEGPGVIAEWAVERDHALCELCAPEGEFPPASEVDMLVVMGGPMGADDEAEHPWLRAEKQFIAETIEAGALVLGVCLGAQLLAEVSGATVSRNPVKEIGWYPVSKTESASEDPVFADFEDDMVVGHWHADSFTVPPAACSVLTSDACANQAFSMLDGRIVGMQFHMEWDEDAVLDLVEHCSVDLDGGEHVMDAAELIEGAASHAPRCNTALRGLLDRMAALPPV